MYPLILCVVCLGLFLQPLSLAQSTSSPSEAVSSTELPFRLSSGYLIQVEGRIGAQTNLKFVLDTGATISVVDRKIVDRLNLELHPAESLSFDRKLKWDSATIPEIQFGPSMQSMP